MMCGQAGLAIFATAVTVAYTTVLKHEPLFFITMYGVLTVSLTILMVVGVSRVPKKASRAQVASLLATASGMLQSYITGVNVRSICAIFIHPASKFSPRVT